MAHAEAVRTPSDSTRPKLGVVDCDVHCYFRDGPRDLCDYMPPAWQQRLGLNEKPHGHGVNFVPGFTLPMNILYYDAHVSLRRDASRDGVEQPGVDPGFVAEHLFDQYGIDRGILLGNKMMGLGGLPEPDTASVIASAHNDWLIERWLRVDKRYRGTVTVGPRDPAHAAAEIDRVGGVSGMVSVFLPLCDIAMGHRHYDPIYAAAERHGLPIQVHPAGIESVFSTAPQMAQLPTYKLEWNTMFPQIHQANLISMLCHGVFERFPKLKFVITEAGFAWLPDVLWRLDASWRTMREEVPWVKRPPSEYIADHVRLCSQPFVEAPRDEDVVSLFQIIDGERILMYASDYPHYDFDEPRRALALLTPEQRKAVLSENALAFFGDRLL